MAQASIQTIAKATGKSRNAVHNYFESPATHGERKISGRPREMTPALTRRSLRAASDKVTSSSALHQSLELLVSSLPVGLALNSSGQFSDKT